MKKTNMRVLSEKYNIILFDQLESYMMEIKFLNLQIIL